MFIGVICEKFVYKVNITTQFFYNAVIDNIRAFKGRLKHYDDIKLNSLDISTLDYLDTLEE